MTDKSASKKIWCTEAKRILNARLKRQGISHSELVSLLSEIGVVETKSGIGSKLSRGSFSAAFMLQVLTVTNPGSQRELNITILDMDS